MGDTHGAQQQPLNVHLGEIAHTQQQPERSNDGEVTGDSIKGDRADLPANMMTLFQQFLASIANKEDSKGQLSSQWM
jgi:hypothetical protein